MFCFLLVANFSWETYHFSESWCGTIEDYQTLSCLSWQLPLKLCMHVHWFIVNVNEQDDHHNLASIMNILHEQLMLQNGCQLMTKDSSVKANSLSKKQKFIQVKLPALEFMTICIVIDSIKHIAMFSVLGRQAESKVHIQPLNFIFKRGPSCSKIWEQLSPWKLEGTQNNLHCTT